MSLLYKKEKDVVYSVDIKAEGNKVVFLFSSDCGKHGTMEQLDEYEFTPKELLQFFQKHHNPF